MKKEGKKEKFTSWNW